MKVTDIKTYVVDCFRTNWVFVKVYTDEGITGVARARSNIRSAWRYNGDDIRFDIAVPNGTVVYLTLPDGSKKKIWAGRYLFVPNSRKMFVD